MKILDNVALCYWLNDWCKEAHLNPKNILFYINREEKSLNICTSSPGYLIGAKGNLYEKYKNKLEEIENKYKCESLLEIKLIECTQADFWVNYDYMGEGF